MSRIRLSLLLSVILLASGPHQLTAQKVLQINDPPECENCLRLDLDLSIGGLDAPGVGPYFQIGMDSKDRIYLSHADVGSEIGVYKPSGDLFRTLGGRGQGPGEYLGVRQIVRVGETMCAMDPLNARETVIGPDLEVVRTNRLRGHPLSIAVLNETERVFSAQIPTESKIGYPLHLVDAEGNITTSFGYEGEVVRWDFPQLGSRRLAASRDGTVWAARFHEYAIDRWEIGGEKVQRLERHVSWFPTELRNPSLSDGEPPPPNTEAIYEDDDGRLWVAILVSDPEWEEGVVEVPGMPPGHNLDVGDYNKFYDTVLEVLDPRSGNLVASQRFDQRLQHFLPDGRIATYRTAENGLPFVDIWRPILNK